jgi:hypothetical protein
MEIRIDAANTQNWIRGLFRDQLPFATSKAINDTASDVQKAIRAGLQERFTIRRPWVTQGITLRRGTKTDLTATVAVDPTRRFLNKFEQGGTKTGTAGQPVAVSTIIQRGSPTLPARYLYPKNLGLQMRRGVTGNLLAHHGGKRGVQLKSQLQGAHRTFVLTRNMFGVNVPGIYQRFGPGRHDFRLLWVYKDSVPIPASLRFASTARETVNAVWAQRFNEAWAYAIRTAK